MKKLLVLVSIIMLLGFVPAANASFVTFDNYTSFIAATSNRVIENFEDTTLVSGLSILEVGGAGSIHDGVYENIVDKDVPRYQVYQYAPGLWAFGAWLDLKNPGGQGVSIDMYIDDTNTFVGNIPNTFAGEFFGFLNDTPFYGVRFEDGGGAGIQETYYSIDLALAPVPIPAALFLLGPGLLGLVGLRRRILG